MQVYQGKNCRIIPPRLTPSYWRGFTLLELKTLGGLKKELNNALTIILRLEKQSLVFVQLKKKDKHTALIVLIAQAEANKQRNLPPKMWTIQKLNKFRSS